MTVVMALAALLLVLVVGTILANRSLETSRAILLHAPHERVWDEVRDFGALHAQHARGRPRLLIEGSALLEGDGLTPRSVWRQHGRWGDSPYWAEIELVAIEPPHRLAVRLRRDSLGTHRGVRRHRCELQLVPEDPSDTKLVLRLSARLTGVRLPALRRLAPEHLRPRLLDLGLRSVKLSIGSAARAGGAEDRKGARGAGPEPAADLPIAAPGVAPRMGDRV